MPPGERGFARSTGCPHGNHVGTRWQGIWNPRWNGAGNRAKVGKAFRGDARHGNVERPLYCRYGFDPAAWCSPSHYSRRMEVKTMTALDLLALAELLLKLMSRIIEFALVIKDALQVPQGKGALQVNPNRRSDPRAVWSTNSLRLASYYTHRTTARKGFQAMQLASLQHHYGR